VRKGREEEKRNFEQHDLDKLSVNKIERKRKHENIDDI
jgi:hypothetical protein